MWKVGNTSDSWHRRWLSVMKAFIMHFKYLIFQSTFRSVYLRANNDHKDLLWCYMSIQVEAFWVEMLCSVVVEYHCFRGPCYLHLQGEAWGSMVLQNIGILPQHHMASQPSRPWHDSLLWKPQISYYISVITCHLVNPVKMFSSFIHNFISWTESHNGTCNF
jgi:hypothetical protein